MENKVTFDEIKKELTKIFASEARTKTYNSEHEQYIMLCGWCGMKSPISRPAFCKRFGQIITCKAEAAARADLEEFSKAYNLSEWAAYKAEADQHESDGQKAPTVGNFVWGLASWLKCDGGCGFIAEIENQEYKSQTNCDDRPTKVLLHVGKVITVSPDEFNRPGLADELSAAEKLPSGGRFEDDKNLCLVAPYELCFNHVTAVTDGARVYYIETEGYTYARYIIFPTDWQTMFAPELSAYRAKINEEKTAKEKAEREEHAKSVATFIARCKKWENLMQPVEDLEQQLRGAKYGTAEYKAVSRKLNNTRRGNILAMCRAAFSGVKFSITRNKGWGESWHLSYTDGPTIDNFMAAVDLDLFITHYDTFDGMTDSAVVEYVAEDFTPFARQYMGSDGNKGIKVERKMSDDTRAALTVKVKNAVPDLPNNNVRRDNLTNDQLEAVCNLVGDDWHRLWISHEGLAEELFDKLDLYTRSEISPETAESDAQTDQTTPGSLTADEYSEKATVVRGYNGTQYEELVAMGGKYNRRLNGGPGIIFSTKKHGATVAEYIASHSV